MQQGNKGTILVVDDEESVRSLGVECVEFFGFESLEACNGAEALDVFKQHVDAICLVILDLTMPVMDGVTAFHELKRIKPDVRVMISSGHSEQSVFEQFPAEKPDAILQKPFQMDELEQKITRVVR